MSLNNNILKGIFWSGLELFLQQSISFIVKIILAKLLFPEEFGLVGMAVVFISFVQSINELGMGAALIQFPEKKLTQLHYNSVFWTSLVWSFLLFVIIYFLITPFAVYFYTEPKLEQIIPVLSLGILASPFVLIPKVSLTRAFNFKKISIITNVANLVAGVIAVTLALLDYGVWALVFNTVIISLVTVPLFLRASKWKPKLAWGKNEFQEIFGFGMYTTGTMVFNNLMSKLDYLLIGKFVSAVSLGYYTFAFLLTDIVRDQIMKIMNKVMYPVYGKKQDDLVSLKRYYLNVIRYNSIMIYPIMVILLMAGAEIISFAFNGKWDGAAMVIRILAVSVMFHLMVSSNTSLIRGLGKPKLEFRIQFFKAIFLSAPLLYFGIYYYGIEGAAFAILINKIASVIIANYFLKKLVDVGFSNLLKSIKEPLIASLISIVTILLLNYFKSLHFVLNTLIIIAIFGVAYWITLKKEFQQVKYMIQNQRNPKKPVHEE